MSYTHTVTVPLAWNEAVQRTREALAAQGFGILSEIDVRATFAAKLGAGPAEELGDYIILGACNPALASRALSAEPDMGALLPCNVVVRRARNASETTIQAIDPQTMVTLSDSPGVRDVANDADTRFRAALATLGGHHRTGQLMPDRIPVRLRAMRTYPEPCQDLVGNLLEAIPGGSVQGSSR